MALRENQGEPAGPVASYVVPQTMPNYILRRRWRAVGRKGFRLYSYWRATGLGVSSPSRAGWPLLAHSRYKPYLTEHDAAVTRAAALLS
jgi:hypothetical protein